MSLRLNAVGRTDVGLRRKRNEDAVHVSAAGRLLVVADGMGGHPGGDRASAVAAERIASLLGEVRPPGSSGGGEAPPSTGEWEERWGGWMAEAVREANRAVVEEGRREPRLRGMGTTLTALLVDPEAGRGVVGHVGDSRAYRLPARGGLRPVTRDHTWVQQRVEAGALDREGARLHPMSHVLIRALGLEDEVEVDVEHVAVEPGDLHLLCSDGLTAMLPDTAVEEILRDGVDGDLDELAEHLVSEANRRGGADNVTVAVLRVEE